MDTPELVALVGAVSSPIVTVAIAWIAHLNKKSDETTAKMIGTETRPHSDGKDEPPTNGNGLVPTGD